MKPILFSFLFLFLRAELSRANPPVKKIHAFKQASIPGMLPRLPENENKPTEERKPNYNYWFYLEVKKKKNIEITGLWINGIRSEIKIDSIKNLPVKKISYNGATVNDTVILAPETRNLVLLIYPSGTGTAVPEATGSKYPEDLISKHELVISYSCKGKKYYAKVRSIRTLAPDVRP